MSRFLNFMILLYSRSHEICVHGCEAHGIRVDNAMQFEGETEILQG